MKFRYLGGKETMVAFGYDFSHGAEPDVTDEHAIAKLSGNSHFAAVGEGEEEAEAPKRRGRKTKAE